MDVYLIDGTYELFRHFFALPPSKDLNGNETGAVRGVTGSLVAMLEQGVTHLGVATDHVVESFRNEMYAGYKTSAGIEPDLLSQFTRLENAVTRLGVKLWAMTEEEADDALAAAAARASSNGSVGRVFICTPDKDLAQCVRGDRVVQLDRRTNSVRDESGVRERFGVPPQSIPDYLALVGDAADGFPGLPGWGAKSAAAILGKYGHLEAIPADPATWDVRVRGAAKLAATLRAEWNDALLFRSLATLRTDFPVFDSIDDLRWNGPRPDFDEFCRTLRAERLAERVRAIRP